MVSRISYSTLGCLLAATGLVIAQQSPTSPSGQAPAQTGPEFRVEINYVEEDVRVVDKDGKFVSGLTRDDFELIEDGKAQKVDVFGLVDIPIVPVEKPLFLGPEAPPIEPDVVSNVESVEGRVYLILIDDYHIFATRSGQAKSLLRRFILDKLGANDQAAVLFTSGNVKNSQWFTRNRQLLLAAVNEFTGSKIRSASLARLDPRARQLQNPDDPNSFDPNDVQDLDAAERMYKARSSVETLQNVVEWLAKIRGRRKAVLYLSEGVDYNAPDIFSGQMNSNYSRDEADIIQSGIRDAINAASRNNVQIYPVDPRGLAVTSEEAVDVDNRYRLPELRIGGPGIDRVSLENELSVSQMHLRQIADETGGIAITATNDFTGGFDRLVQENSSYYVLGYYPTNDKYDGRLRSITVKVKGYSDDQVTYRKRYAAIKAPDQPKPVEPAGTVEAALNDAMVSPLPMTGLSMKMTAIPRKGAGKSADVAVLVEASGKDLKFKQSGGTFNMTLSMSIGVFDKSGKWVAGEQPVLKLSLKPNTYAAVMRSGLRVLAHLTVPPGQYQIRVASQDSVGLKQGSIHFDVEVPDFSKGSLALSGVAIASTADLTVPTGKDETFRAGLPGAPTVVREFSPSDEIAAFMEIYDNKPVPPHGMDITTNIKDSTGKVVFSDGAERSTEELKGSPVSYTFTYSVRVPLKGWQAGLYVMEIVVKSRLGDSQPLSRTIPFKVH